VVSTPIFTSTRDGLDLELDNVYQLTPETPGSSVPFQLNYTSSKILLKGGTWIQGGTLGIGTLPATKSLNVTVERALLDANFIKGGAGNFYPTFYPGNIVPDFSLFTGTISGSDKLRDQLADTGGDHFDFGAHKLRNVADPTLAQDVATKAYVDASVGGPLNNFAATVDPTTTDDSGSGYSVGSRWINTTTDSVFALVDATPTAAVWRLQSGTKAYIFTSTTAPWTVPSWAVELDCILIGGGGGGGSGRKGAASTARTGGAGGGGGGRTRRLLRVAGLPSLQLDVTVGTGGPGGASQSTDSTNGSAGTAGNASTVALIAGDGGTVLARANGGNGGGAGSTSAATGGSSSSTLSDTAGGSGGNSSATGGTGTAGAQVAAAPGGGAGAGGLRSAAGEAGRQADDQEQQEPAPHVAPSFFFDDQRALAKAPIWAPNSTAFAARG